MPLRNYSLAHPIPALEPRYFDVRVRLRAASTPSSSVVFILTVIIAVKRPEKDLSEFIDSYSWTNSDLVPIITWTYVTGTTWCDYELAWYELTRTGTTLRLNCWYLLHSSGWNCSLNWSTIRSVLRFDNRIITGVSLYLSVCLSVYQVRSQCTQILPSRLTVLHGPECFSEFLFAHLFFLFRFTFSSIFGLMCGRQM